MQLKPLLPFAPPVFTHTLSSCTTLKDEKEKRKAKKLKKDCRLLLLSFTFVFLSSLIFALWSVLWDAGTAEWTETRQRTSAPGTDGAATGAAHAERRARVLPRGPERGEPLGVGVVLRDMGDRVPAPPRPTAPAAARRRVPLCRRKPERAPGRGPRQPLPAPVTLQVAAHPAHRQRRQGNRLFPCARTHANRLIAPSSLSSSLSLCVVFCFG